MLFTSLFQRFGKLKVISLAVNRILKLVRTEKLTKKHFKMHYFSEYVKYLKKYYSLAITTSIVKCHSK